jgi:ABC-2 type transport system permease protein
MSRTVTTPARAGLLRYAGLTWFLCRVSLRRLVTYRADFLLGAAGFVVRIGVQCLLIGVVFSWVPTLDGWTRDQVLFLFGFALLPRGLDRLFTDWLWFIAGRLVYTGEFDRYLVRPLPPLYSIMAERFLWPDGVAELVVGLSLVGYAGHQLGVPLWSIDALVVAPLCVLCGALIYASVKLLGASLAFWLVISHPAMHAANQVSEFASFPVGLYPGPFQWVLTWVLPFAFTAAVPVSYLFTGEPGHLVWLPLVTAGAVAVALATWTRGLARYQSTGN